MGKKISLEESASGIPVIVIRGLDHYCEDETYIKKRYRLEEQNIIKKGLCCLQKKLIKEEMTSKLRC